MGAAWHLDYIVVTNTRSGQAAKFVYKNWFDSKAGWTQNLFPEGVVPDVVRCKLRPFIIVHGVTFINKIDIALLLALTWSFNESNSIPTLNRAL